MRRKILGYCLYHQDAAGPQRVCGLVFGHVIPVAYLWMMSSSFHQEACDWKRDKEWQEQKDGEQEVVSW